MYNNKKNGQKREKRERGDLFLNQRVHSMDFYHDNGTPHTSMCMDFYHLYARRDSLMRAIMRFLLMASRSIDVGLPCESHYAHRALREKTQAWKNLKWLKQCNLSVLSRNFCVTHVCITFVTCQHRNYTYSLRTGKNL